jgi:acetyl-CoA carboxylase biotin carboxyl carrier protein
MDVARIKSLIDLVAEEDIAELDITDPDGSIHIVRVAQDVAAQPESPAPTSGSAAPVLVVPTSVPAGASAAAHGSPLCPAAASRHIKAPMVGTFYRSANKHGGSLIQAGAVVEVGTPLCVIEAMKIMNEIESDMAGTVTQVLCQNGQAVERGQALFVIE